MKTQLLLITVLLGLTGCAAKAPPTHTLRVALTLTDSSGTGIEAFGSSCDGMGGYSDISSGGNVTLKDGNGNIIGSATLNDGTGDSSTCNFSVSLSKVPEVPFYSLTVGNRSAISYSLSDLKSDDWSVSLNLGS